MNFDKNELERMTTAIGSLCEVAGLMRDNLLRCGFTREETIYIIAEFMSNIIKGD